MPEHEHQRLRFEKAIWHGVRRDAIAGLRSGRGKVIEAVLAFAVTSSAVIWGHWLLAACAALGLLVIYLGYSVLVTTRRLFNTAQNTLQSDSGHRFAGIRQHILHIIETTPLGNPIGERSPETTADWFDATYDYLQSVLWTDGASSFKNARLRSDRTVMRGVAALRTIYDNLTPDDILPLDVSRALQ